MWNSRRRTAVLGGLALGAIGLIVARGVRAQDVPAPPKAPDGVYDVRVVRVDPADAAVVEAAPPWQDAGAAGATTSAPWADLLAGLKTRGRTTILLDQRVTAMEGAYTEFKQQRRRPVLTLRTRSDKSEVWESTYVESGATGRLLPTPGGLQYEVDVRWEERPAREDVGTPEGMPLLGEASWKGSHGGVRTGETLVLSYRQQQAAGAAEAPQALEIYVFVTLRAVSAK